MQARTGGTSASNGTRSSGWCGLFSVANGCPGPAIGFTLFIMGGVLYLIQNATLQEGVEYDVFMVTGPRFFC